MPRHEKKIILVLVEGESDEISFEGVLKDFFSSSDVRVHVMRCDITIKDCPRPSEILKKIKEPIDDFLSVSKLLKSDIQRIVHLVDTDGAFVPDSCVVSAAQDKVSYSEDTIFAPNAGGIKRRNAIKSAVLSKLCGTNSVYGDIPYHVFFLSRNLEHVLHNRMENLSSSEKARLSDRFDEQFEGRLHDFLRFISDPAFAVPGNYKETWAFIQQGTNSLRRHSNVHLLFSTEERPDINSQTEAIDSEPEKQADR